jgi:hypothetical protein
VVLVLLMMFALESVLTALVVVMLPMARPLDPSAVVAMIPVLLFPSESRRPGRPASSDPEMLAAAKVPVARNP